MYKLKSLPNLTSVAVDNPVLFFVARFGAKAAPDVFDLVDPSLPWVERGLALLEVTRTFVEEMNDDPVAKKHAKDVMTASDTWIRQKRGKKRGSSRNV